ncbi:MAG: DUF2207 domain-containing protein [Clostridia bacterium]|nr:DUF2207 domain-containing protein [Clostridia bacterium]
MIGLKKFLKYFFNYLKNRKNFLKWFLGIIILFAILVAIFFSPLGKEELTFYEGGAIFFASLAMVIYPLLPIIGIILGYRLSKFRQEIDKLSYSDLKNSEEYYREFLQNYSPVMLSYIDEFEIGAKDIVATLMNLELKGKVKISDEKIDIISNDFDSLDLSERHILEALKSESFISANLIEELREIVKNDARKQGLICEKKLRRKGIIKGLFKGTLTFLALIIAFFASTWLLEGIRLLFNLSEGFLEVMCVLIFGTPSLIIIALILMYPMAVGVYCVSSYIQTFYVKNEYRTDKAEEINEKMEGLKNFLKDFSLLDEKQKKDIELWDKYLIYSVMFGQNKEILKEFEKYYN